MTTPKSVMDRIPEDEKCCAFCKYLLSDCETEGRKCINLSDDYTENYFEPDSFDWYSDCDNCKHQSNDEYPSDECLQCKRHYEDMWEAK